MLGSQINMGKSSVEGTSNFHMMPKCQGIAMKRLWWTISKMPVCIVLAGLLVGCASRPVEEEIAVGPEQVDKLYVVDCLLPAQVRKLGQHFTYLAARRPIRTTAVDCEIRGGEYVAYDRSNYATALKVWLPKAKDGDPQAQTYVGEIFEKGLGIQPDYDAAAQWYRKAAEQDYAAAMINLGFLYEKGLGVERDPVAALNWYRKASGLDQTDIAFAASVEVYNRKMASLREEAAQYRQEAAGLREQLATLQQQHQQTQKYLRRYREQMEASRREIQRLKRKLQSIPQAPGADSSQQSEALKQRLEQQMMQLQEKEKMVALLEKEVAEQSQKMASLQEGSAQAVKEKEAEIQDLKTQLARRNQALLALRRQLTESQSRLKELRQQIVGDNQSLDAQMKIQRELQQQLEEKQATGTASREELARLTEALKTKQAEIDRKKAEIASVKSEMAELSETNRNLQQQLTQRQQQLAQLENRLGSAEQLVQTKEGQVETLQAEIARRDESLKALRRQLADANDRLISRKQTVQALQQQLAQKQTDSNVSQAELAMLAARLQEKEAEVNRQQEIIQGLKANVAELEKQQQTQPKQATPLARAESTSEEGTWIEIIDPPLRPQRGSLMVVTRGMVEARTVVGQIHSSAGILAFNVNDRDFATEPDGTFKVKVPLKGKETPVHLVAVDRDSRRTELNFIIFRDAKTAAPAPDLVGVENESNQGESLAKALPRQMFGGYHALIIGNNDYQYLPKLDTPINDAKALARVLRDRYGFETRLLLDASRYDLLKALNEYRKTLTEKDNLLVYYAGHGTLEKVTQRGYWLPVDAELENTANWVSNQDITDILRIMSAAHVMVIADSCYSGALTRSSVARLEAGMTPEKKAEWIKMLLKARSRVALTSGGLNPVLDGGGGGHSVFAKALIQALENNRRIVESFRLYTEVSALVADAAKDQNFHQVPEFSPIRHAGHEAGEFFFVPRQGAGLQAGL